MLNDILDLCIEKSDWRYFYEFKYSGLTGEVTVSKWESRGGCIRVWSRDFHESELESALELMENE